jgi:membrane-bound lytic murein transglycosylase D
VAQCVDDQPATLQDLNPGLLRWTTPKDQSFELRLPTGTKDKYLATIEAIPPAMRVWWRYHKVSQGDTLASIARSYRTTPQAIARTNELDADASLLPDTKLIIPIAPGKHAASEDAGSYARRATPYRVRKGDTVQTVAENFGVPPAMVRRWNLLKSESLRGHRVVYVHLPVAPGSNDAQRSSTAGIRSKSGSKSKSSKALRTSATKPVVHHKVQQGETLTSIATTHHTTVKAIQRDNNIASLRPGMVLIIHNEQ